MKITELEHLSKGDFLIIEPLPELCSSVIDFTRIRVQFMGFGDDRKSVILYRVKAKTIPTDRIEVFGRYTPSPHRKSGNHHN